MSNFFEDILKVFGGFLSRPRKEKSVLERSKFGMGDNVRIVTTSETERLNFAGRIGMVYGVTQPSSSGVTDVVGNLHSDLAVNVHFTDLDKQYWFSEELIQFEGRTEIAITLDSAPGKKFVRDTNGAWREEEN